MKGKNRKITLILEEKGVITLKKPRYPNVPSVRGAAGKLPRPLSWEKMREIAREEYAQERGSSGEETSHCNDRLLS